MKKYIRLIFTTLLLGICYHNVSAEDNTSTTFKSGYRGFVDVDACGADDSFYVGIGTTHGIQLHKNGFIGMGLKGGYVTEDDDFYGIVYARGRFDSDIFKQRWNGFMQCDLGICASENVGMSLALTGGLRYMMSSRLGLNLGLTVNYNPVVYGAGISIGMDF